ncbi:MAG TPA: ABC transporter permease [Anaerolineales bacterium]|nr:ABC transporter permease [Anaerolineales bacterium]
MPEKTKPMEKETMSESKANHIEEIHATQGASKRFGVALDKFITFAAVIVLFIFFSIIAKNFFTARSVLSLLLQTSAVTIMGIGVTFTIITGGIDLSIGSVIALSGTVAVMAAIAGVPIWLSMIIGLLVGAACGFVNGLMITRLKLPPFIATLGMMMVARGVALTITNANAWPAPEGFGVLGNGTIFGTGPKFPGISYPVLLMVAVAILFSFILTKTRIGRYTYAVGSNEEAARLSGIKVNQVKVTAYIISGLLAGLVGIILASRMVTSQPNSADGYELNAIASAVIGGTSLMGGVGTVAGTVIGSFIIGILSVGLTMAGANYFLQKIVIGLVVIGAVTVDQLKGRRK